MTERTNIEWLRHAINSKLDGKPYYGGIANDRFESIIADLLKLHAAEKWADKVADEWKAENKALTLRLDTAEKRVKFLENEIEHLEAHAETDGETWERAEKDRDAALLRLDQIRELVRAEPKGNRCVDRIWELFAVERQEVK